MTRRGLMRRGSAATVATLGVGAGAHHHDLDPVGDAQAIAPAALVAGAAISYTGAGAVGYVAYKNAKKFLGDDVPPSDFTGSDALHHSVYETALNMQSADERVRTSIQNNISNSANIALPKAKAAIIEVMNNNGSESDAVAAMEDAIDGYYSTIQENIITHWNSQVDRVIGNYDSVQTHSDLVIDDVFKIHVTSGNYSDSDYTNPGLSKDGVSTVSHDLLDGSSVDVTEWEVVVEKSGFTVADQTFTPLEGFNDLTPHFQILHPGSDDPAVILDSLSFLSMMDQIQTERDNVHAEMSGFVADVYAEYSAGDIPTEDLVDPITAATELDAGYDGYQTQAAHAAMMGIPTNAEQTLTLEIEGDEGGTSTVEADIYTNHVPTDGSGNEVGFQPGTRYEPSTWDEPLYVSYSYVETNDSGEVTNEEQDFVQLENPFTVVEAFDKEGNEVTSFTPTSRNNQTADVTKIEEELAQIREEQIAMQEEAEEEMNSGGGGGGIVDDLFGGNPAVGGIVALVAGGALLQIAKSFTE